MSLQVWHRQQSVAVLPRGLWRAGNRQDIVLPQRDRRLDVAANVFAVAERRLSRRQRRVRHSVSFYPPVVLGHGPVHTSGHVEWAQK